MKLGRTFAVAASRLSAPADWAGWYADNAFAIVEYDGAQAALLALRVSLAARRSLEMGRPEAP